MDREQRAVVETTTRKGKGMGEKNKARVDVHVDSSREGQMEMEKGTQKAMSGGGDENRRWKRNGREERKSVRWRHEQKKAK